MKVFRKASFASFILVVLGVAIVPIPTRMFWGEIMDSLCAQVGSHETASRSLRTTRECTIGCVESGAKFVLYNPRTHETFQLDDQQKPRQYAGEQVMILGVHNRNTNAIHVVAIEPAHLETIATRATLILARLRGH